MALARALRTLVAVVSGLCAAAPAQSADVAVGVFPFLVGNMDGRVNEIVQNCTTRGIDTLYVSAYRTTGPSRGDLWITDSAGAWNASWGPVRSTGAGINLQNLITACHAANVRVVAVLKCFDTTVQPTDAAHRQFLLDVIDYFTDTFRPDGRPVYDLDGIALDYIRFVETSTQIDPALVTAFLAEVRQHIGPMSLHCYLVASRFTFDGGTYNGNFQSYATVIAQLAAQYGQHWQQMAQYVDVMMPMAYTADGSIYNTAALHQAYVRQTAAYARTACQLASQPGRRVCPVVRTYSDTAETTTVATIDASITGALLGGADGYQAFRYQHIVNNPTWWGPMQQHAVPGCNWPEPELTVLSPALTASLDASLSRDADEPSAGLQVRFDFDGDGVIDTGWLGNGVHPHVQRYPGSWTVAMQVRDAAGHVSTTRRRMTAGPALTVTPNAVPAATGGVVQMQVDVGSGGAGSVYLMLATLSGTSPGFVWRPGFPVPINFDFLTSAFAANPNGAFLQQGLGVLDAQGRATATLLVPAGLLAPLIGTTVHWSFLAADSLGRPLCVGEADPLSIQ